MRVGSPHDERSPRRGLFPGTVKKSKLKPLGLGMGKLSGDARHAHIPHARTEGRSQGRSRSAWTFSGRELERVQQDRAGSSQGSSGRARKAVGAVEHCWISLADHVIGVQTEYTFELGFLSY